MSRLIAARFEHKNIEMLVCLINYPPGTIGSVQKSEARQKYATSELNIFTLILNCNQRERPYEGKGLKMSTTKTFSTQMYLYKNIHWENGQKRKHPDTKISRK